MEGRRSKGTKKPVNLPPADTQTWGRLQKAAVIRGIREGLITEEQARVRYGLSSEELDAWEAAFDRGGHAALSAKALLHRRTKRVKDIAD